MYGGDINKCLQTPASFETHHNTTKILIPHPQTSQVSTRNRQSNAHSSQTHPYSIFHTREATYLKDQRCPSWFIHGTTLDCCLTSGNGGRWAITLDLMSVKCNGVWVTFELMASCFDVSLWHSGRVELVLFSDYFCVVCFGKGTLVFLDPLL